jgi:hypothetical protein
MIQVAYRNINTRQFFNSKTCFMKHKYSSLLFVAIILYANAFAQPVIKTQRAAGGSLTEELTVMYVTKDGGLIVGGYSNSGISYDKTENSRGNFDYWIVKYDSLHNIEWDKTIGGSSADYLQALQQTSDGGYILGGQSQSGLSGDKTENSRGFFDYWVVKLDSTGSIEWDKTIGGSNDDFFASLSQTRDGGYILEGHSSSNISGDKTEDNKCGCSEYDNHDYWIVKLTSTGAIEWDKTIGGTDWDRSFVHALIPQTADGGYLVGGYSDSDQSGDKSENSINSSRDYWIIKIDSLGNIEWDKTIGGDGYEELMAIVLTSDGGFILGGTSGSNQSGDKTENSRGSADYWIVKCDKDGEIQWDKTIGSSDYDWFYSVEQTLDGGYIIGGYTTSDQSGEKTENGRGNFDYWVVKINSKGKVQWDKTIGGTDADECAGVKELGKNRYVVGGESFSKATGDKKKLSRGFKDYWLVGLFNKTGSGNSGEAVTQADLLVSVLRNNNNFKAYPNPANNSITVTYTAQKSSRYIFEIADMNGRVVLHKEVNTMPGTNRTTIDISRFAKGIYAVSVIKPDASKESIRISKE